MLNNSSKIMFTTIMMMGTMISVSANSWLGAWVGLEINLLAFIPLMTASNNLMSSEAALKYFLTQALASSVLLMSVMMSMMKNGMMNDLMNMKYAQMMIMSTLLMKSGAAPFHFWFPSVMEGLTWMNSLILMTWQKIAPLMLISLTIPLEQIKIMMLITLLSVMVGSIGGLNQTSLRKIMAFSSINHMGWMIAAMMSSESLWTTYFIIYSILTTNIVTVFNLMKTTHINQLFTTMYESKTQKFIVFLNLLSLGGLPPFLGFLPKWIVIQQLVSMNQMMLMTLMTVMSLVTLFFYIRISYSAFMLNHYEQNWGQKQFQNSLTATLLMIFSFTSNFTLFSASVMFSIM